MTQIEKIARLIGHNTKRLNPVNSTIDKHYSNGDVYIYSHGKDGWFNPLTNKADLMDVECALDIDIEWLADGGIRASNYDDYFLQVDADFKEQDSIESKFTARAHAVCAVAEQIYDNRTDGK